MARYVALKPVRARLVQRAQDWRWSSVAAHLAGRDDDLVSVAALLDRCAGRWSRADSLPFYFVYPRRLLHSACRHTAAAARAAVS